MAAGKANTAVRGVEDDEYEQVLRDSLLIDERGKDMHRNDLVFLCKRWGLPFKGKMEEIRAMVAAYGAGDEARCKLLVERHERRKRRSAESKRKSQALGDSDEDAGGGGTPVEEQEAEARGAGRGEASGALPQPAREQKTDADRMWERMSRAPVEEQVPLNTLEAALLPPYPDHRRWHKLPGKNEWIKLDD